MNRRGFLGMLALLLPGMTLVGCGGSSDDEIPGVTPDEGGNTTPDAQIMCTADGAVTYINPGHAHTTSALTMAEIDAAVVGGYNLMGGGHSHMVPISAQNFTDLQAGMSVTITEPDHGHMVTIQCPTA